MRQMMSLTARQELSRSIAPRYRQATWKQKGQILDEFVAATGYARKHAIARLARDDAARAPGPARKRRYDQPVREALATLWRAANRICAKRLVPFLPELVDVMQRCGHLTLDPNVRERLLAMSISTADRLLAPERQRDGRGLSTTRPGQLLKRQITVRTFADWDDVRPGFFEIDLVAHCGEWAGGSFLNTLVLTDVATGWTECHPLRHRSEAGVIAAIGQARQSLPFPVRGLDTDNGGEFINYEMLRYCEREGITFTRARTYRKNDQCHVEQKNGSVVRRLVGYRRYEGTPAWQTLSAMYPVLRQYVNFFQPSLKLAEKQREGTHVTRRYEPAQTPFQRLVGSGVLAPEGERLLRSRYEALDPVLLLSQLARLQEQLWPLACAVSRPVPALGCLPDGLRSSPAPPAAATAGASVAVSAVSAEPATPPAPTAAPTAVVGPRRAYRRTKPDPVPHTWRTRVDPFAGVCERLRLRLVLDPGRTAKELLLELQGEQPDCFAAGQLRTLQRRVRSWRRELLASACAAVDFVETP